MKVKCITPTTHLTVGKVYEVLLIDQVGADTYYKIINDENREMYQQVERFEEVKC